MFRAFIPWSTFIEFPWWSGQTHRGLYRSSVTGLSPGGEKTKKGNHFDQLPRVSLNIKTRSNILKVVGASQSFNNISCQPTGTSSCQNSGSRCTTTLLQTIAAETRWWLYRAWPPWDLIWYSDHWDPKGSWLSSVLKNAKNMAPVNP